MVGEFAYYTGLSEPKLFFIGHSSAHVQGPFYLMTRSVVISNGLYGSIFRVHIAANCKGVCLQNTSKSNSYHLKIWRLL